MLAIGLLQLSSVQQYIIQRVLSSITEKTSTRISVGSVSIAFTHSIVLNSIFIESRERDTLLSIGTIAVDVNLLGLLSHTVNVTNLRIDSVTAHVTRSLPDSSFNFDFILSALTGDQASVPEGTDTTTTDAWKVMVGRIELNDFFGTYEDEVSGVDLHFRLGQCETTIHSFDLEKTSFTVEKISLKNSSVNLLVTRASVPDTAPSELPAISVESVDLSNLQFFYENRVSNDQYAIEIGSSQITAEQVQLPQQRIALKEFTLDHSRIAIQQGTSSKSTIDDADAEVQPWFFRLASVHLLNNTVSVDIHGAVRTEGLDPNHLRFEQLTLQAENISYSANSITAFFNHASFKEQSGIELRELSGTIELDSVHVQATDLTIETPASRLHQNIRLEYSSLSELKRLDGTIRVEAAISESHIAFSELLHFQPTLPLKDSVLTVMKFSATVSGTVENLSIDHCSASMGDSTIIELSGSILGLPDAERALYELHLAQFRTSRKDISAIVSDSLLPVGIKLPASLSLSGKFIGTTSQFTSSAELVSSIGAISASATLDSGRGNNDSLRHWSTAVAIKEFNLGALLNDPEQFGPITGTAAGEGTGTDPKQMSGKLSVVIDRAVFNGYDYPQLTLNGTGGHGRYTATAALRDSSISLQFNGTANFTEESPAASFLLEVNGADLQKLHFTDESIRVAGNISGDLSGSSISSLNGTVAVRNIVMMKNSAQYRIDSIVASSVMTEGQTHLSIVSPILEARFDGTIALEDLPAALNLHLEHYVRLKGGIEQKRLRSQAFSFKIILLDHSIVTNIFLPDLHHATIGNIEGLFNSDTHELKLSLIIPKIAYADIVMDSLKFTVSSDKAHIMADVTVQSIIDSMFQITNLHASGLARDDTMHVLLNSMRDDTFTKLLVAGIVRGEEDGYSIRLNTDGLMIHNILWNIPADHQLRIGKRGIIAKNFRLQGNGQTFSIANTKGKDKQPSVTFAFDAFNVSTLSKIIARDTGLIGGSLSGTIMTQNGDRQKLFTAALRVSDFNFAHHHLGDIDLRLQSLRKNIFDIRVNITGNDNRLSLTGAYGTEKNSDAMDLTCVVTTVNLATLEPFTFGAVKQLSGTMTGRLHLTGTPRKPVLLGSINFVHTAFTPSFLETHLRLSNGTLHFISSGIDISGFDFIDINGNSASVQGRLTTKNYQQFNYDIRVKSNKFLLLNKRYHRTALVYGSVVVTSNGSIRGNENKQFISMQASIVKGTDLALVMPASEQAVEERKGIVQFAGLPAPLNTILSGSAVTKNQDTTSISASSMDITSNISVNKDSKLRILIDPVAGDSLVVQGDATFSVTVDPGGKLSVTGRYEIANGFYRLSFGDFINREFIIAKGSSLTWLGTPTDADIDITAIYTVKASILDLIQGQLTGMSNEERNKYKQKLPIQVFMSMKGKLRSPNIHFTLNLPSDQRGVLNGTVYAKLMDLNEQESELNKQVFALLVLGRFVQENPISSADGGDGISDLARSSVSQILSAQLNRLSEKYIAGASLDVGLESYKDYSSGTAEGRTQLQLALSKQLFNERVTVKVGGNVDLEGQRSQKNSLENVAGDLTVQYKLTEDGRWQLQVFRQNAYEGAIDGDITKTGAGVTFTIDFDKLFGITLKPETDEEE